MMITADRFAFILATNGRAYRNQCLTLRFTPVLGRATSAVPPVMARGDKIWVMSALREQALGIIDVCKTAQQRFVDQQTIAIAQAIVAEAKAMLPNDKVIAAANLEPPVTFWTSVQAAMEIVANSLPPKEVAAAD